MSWFIENVHYVNSRVIGDDVLDKQTDRNLIDAVAFYHGLIMARKIRTPKENEERHIRDGRMTWDEYSSENPKTPDGYFDYAGEGKEP